MALDDQSRRILRLLQRDARRPYAEIAAELGLDEDDVVRRVSEAVRGGVDRLVADGVVSFTVVTDPLMIGFAREAMLGITFDPDLTEEERDATTRAVAEVPDVHYLVRVEGAFDLLCEVIGISDAHLLEVLTRKVKPIAGISRVHTYLYLSTEKLTYDYGLGSD